ncbi:MAG: hypothetical protein ACNA7U_06535 [Candidatus Izemoplasmataceae bacterium]
MDYQQFIQKYWAHYLYLESDFIETNRYVSIDSANYSTYSIEYLKLLQTICGEVDVVFKVMLQHIDSNYEGQNIQDHFNFIMSNQRDLFSKEPKEEFSNNIVKPFEVWNTNTTYIPLTWWKSYNKVKHNRTGIDAGIENYKLANLENTINALAALFILNLYLCKKIVRNPNPNAEIFSPQPISKLFLLEGWNSEVIFVGNSLVFVEVKPND